MNESKTNVKVVINIRRYIMQVLCNYVILRCLAVVAVKIPEAEIAGSVGPADSG